MPKDHAAPAGTETQPEAPDAALMALYSNGDPGAARLLTVRHLPRVLAFATRMLGDRAEAEDVAQEAMMRLWRIAPEWKPEAAKVSTWLYRVTANLCTDRLRRRGRAAGLDDTSEPADGAAGVEAGLIAADRADALRQALAELPERQRQAVILRHIEGLDNPAIAEAMDTGIEAVESLIARGKRGLMARLAPRRSELGYDDD
nr:RNA polymerase sigma factor [Alkalilacustris brevis]